MISHWTPLPAAVVTCLTIGAMPHRPKHGHAGADDAGGEVVHQHFEACPRLLRGELVDLLEQERGERADDHRAEEHRYARADHDADRCDGTDYRAALTMNDPAAGVPDEHRKQESDDRADEGGEVSVRQPAGGDEESSDQAPGDERADVGHHHPGQIAAEALNVSLEPASGDLWSVRSGHVDLLVDSGYAISDRLRSGRG